MSKSKHKKQKVLLCDDGQPLEPGPWIEDQLSHPDNFYDFEYKGIHCAITKSPLYIWYGYAKLPKDHPLYHKDYLDKALSDIQVHGGLSYSNGQGVFGFDTAHIDLGDYVPGLACLEEYKKLIKSNAHYWTFDDVKQETENLAEQFLSYYKTEKFSNPIS
jgi:hypothetical protein